MTSQTPSSTAVGIQINLTVSVVVFSLRENQLMLLLVPCDTQTWGLPGRMMQPDQSLETSASQEIALRTGVHEAYLEQLYTYGNPERDPQQRTVTVVYFALIPAGVFHPEAGSKEEGRWFSADNLPRLSFDHAEIITYAVRRLRYKLEYSAVGFELLPENFTLSELQHTYEMILGEKLDKRNFRRRILEAGVIEVTPHLRAGEGRPARLYRYRPDAVAEVKARRLFP